MTNSIRFILSKRNMQEKELIKNASKQAVSKWVMRQRKINVNIIPIWEECLGVPSVFFIDDKGYCKELTDSELYELECYISEVCWEGFLNDEIELQFAS